MTSNQTNKADVSSPDVKASADVFETLVEALSHPDSSVRQSAAAEFGKRKDKRGITPLLDILGDDDAVVRLAAAQALNDIGWRPADDVQKASHAVALQQFQVAAEIGEAAIDSILLLLKDSDVGMRIVALEILAQMPNPRLLGPVVNVLKDDNAQLRAVAAQVLSRINVPETVENLGKLSRDASWEVRSAALDGLAGFNTSRAVDFIATFLNDSAADLRVRASDLLGLSQDTRAIAPLVQALIDEDGSVRAAAEQNLKNLDANWEQTQYARGAASALLPALKHENDLIREKAASVLRSVGHIRAMNSFLTAESGTTSNSAIAVLSNALKATSRDLRQAAAEALGRLNDPDAVPMLVSALSDDDQYVREAALYSLNLLNWKPANDAEVVVKAVILQRWDTAVLFDTLAFEPLIRSLNCDDPETCKAAISALGQIGDKRATEPVAFMMQHPTKGVRTAAAHALRALGWLPSDARESVRQAIELEDWMTVAQHGAAAVEPLIATIKENYENEELRNAAATALASIGDGQALKPLLGYSRDGQLAEMVIAALTNLVESHVEELASEDLQALNTLSNIFQFRYAFDARYGKLVRSGLQEVDSSNLKKIAMQELARRGV